MSTSLDTVLSRRGGGDRAASVHCHGTDLNPRLRGLGGGLATTSDADLLGLPGRSPQNYRLAAIADGPRRPPRSWGRSERLCTKCSAVENSIIGGGALSAKRGRRDRAQRWLPRARAACMIAPWRALSRAPRWFPLVRGIMGWRVRRLGEVLECIRYSRTLVACALN